MTHAGPHGYEIVEVADRGAWRSWLEQQHSTAKGAWVVRPRRGADGNGIDYEALVEEALRFGWIDSREQPIDDEHLMQLVTPRKPGSPWARSNKARVERVVLADAGQRVVDAAKADGSWNRYDSAEALELPGDLVAALESSPAAADQFERFSDAAKRSILRWLIDAKRDATRAKRIAETVRLAAKGERAGP